MRALAWEAHLRSDDDDDGESKSLVGLEFKIRARSRAASTTTGKTRRRASWGWCSCVGSWGLWRENEMHLGWASTIDLLTSLCFQKGGREARKRTRPRRCHFVAFPPHFLCRGGSGSKGLCACLLCIVDPLHVVLMPIVACFERLALDPAKSELRCQTISDRATFLALALHVLMSLSPHFLTGAAAVMRRRGAGSSTTS